MVLSDVNSESNSAFGKLDQASLLGTNFIVEHAPQSTESLPSNKIDEALYIDEEEDKEKQQKPNVPAAPRLVPSLPRIVIDQPPLISSLPDQRICRIAAKL